MPRHRRNTKSTKLQLDSQLKYIMGGLCAALMLVLAVAWSLGNSENPVSILIIYFSSTFSFVFWYRNEWSTCNIHGVQTERSTLHLKSGIIVD